LHEDTALARPRRRDAPDWGSEAIVCLWAWLVMAGCFAGLALHAASGHIARTDLRLLNASRRLPDAIAPFVDYQERIGNPPQLGLCVAVLAILLIARRAWLEGLATISAFSVFAVAVVIKHVVHEVPPFKDQHAEYAGLLESNYSFPSGHVVGLSVLCGLIFIFADRITGNSVFVLLLRLAALACIVTVGPGRIWLSVHYPSDVVAGYLLAAMFLLPVWFCVSLWRRTMRRQDET